MAITIVKKRAINLMTLILAINCKDTLVVAADGRIRNFETEELMLETVKIFELTKNSAILVSGEGIVDKLEKYIDELCETVRIIGHQNLTDIANDVRKIIDRRNWAEYKDNLEKSHMSVLVAGYDGDQAKISVILDNRDFLNDQYCYALGGWDEANKYLAAKISEYPDENTVKTGKMTAIKTLSKAQKAEPEGIGRPFMIWHITKNGIRKLSTEEVSRLDQRYGEAEK